jgi:hypothetical protein
MRVSLKKNINNYRDIRGEDSDSESESSSSDESTGDSEKNIESKEKSSPDINLPFEELNIEDKSNSDLNKSTNTKKIPSTKHYSKSSTKPDSKSSTKHDSKSITKPDFKSSEKPISKSSEKPDLVVCKKSGDIKQPNFTPNERKMYENFKGKSKFDSPEEEYNWAKTQTKTCSKCNIDKKLIEFEKNTSGYDGFDKDGYRRRRPECSSCTKSSGTTKKIAIKLAKNLGILYKAPQGTKCAICECDASSGNGIVFDHSHETGKPRGYCCNSCNRSLGIFKDNVKGLIKAINYILIYEPIKIRQGDDGLLYTIDE